MKPAIEIAREIYERWSEQRQATRMVLEDYIAQAITAARREAFEEARKIAEDLGYDDERNCRCADAIRQRAKELWP